MPRKFPFNQNKHKIKFDHPDSHILEECKNQYEIFKKPYNFLEIGLHERLSIRDWGRIYHKEDTDTVLKVLNALHFIDEAASQKFNWEAYYGLQLNHPNLIKTLNAYHIADGEIPLPIIELEHLKGITLDRLIYLHELQGKQIEPPVVLEILAQIAEALVYLHSDMGLSHRDIKPKNIMVLEKQDELKIKVFDLGIICHIGHEPMRISGTLQYLPLRNLKVKSVTHHYDIYALGVTALELCQCDLSFFSDIRLELDHLRKSWPSTFVDLVTRMLDENLHSNPTALQVLNKILKIQNEVGYKI